MSDYIAAARKNFALLWVAVAALLLSTMLPLLSNSNTANALQILDRYVHIVDSSASGAETDYDVSFQLPDSVTFGAMRIEFCDEDPLPGEDCSVTTTESDEVPDLDDDAGTEITITNFAIADAPGDTVDNATGCTTDTLATTHTGGSDLNYLDITCNATETTAVTETGPGTGTDREYVNFRINNVNNPSNTTSGNDNDTFYVRIYTFSGTSTTAYNQSNPPLGNYEGGLAMSTAQQINVTARVQEELTFRVGADEQADDCVTFTQTTVDLGVLSSTQVNFASDEPNTGADSDIACVEVTTNASNGVNVYYIGAELSTVLVSVPMTLRTLHQTKPIRVLTRTVMVQTLTTTPQHPTQTLQLAVNSGDYLLSTMT